MKESVQAAKARSGSYAHLNLPTIVSGAQSRDNVCGPQNPKSSKVSGDTNSEQDICIPAIFVKVVTLGLSLSIQTDKYKKTLECWMNSQYWKLILIGENDETKKQPGKRRFRNAEVEARGYLAKKPENIGKPLHPVPTSVFICIRGRTRQTVNRLAELR